MKAFFEKASNPKLGKKVLGCIKEILSKNIQYLEKQDPRKNNFSLQIKLLQNKASKGLVNEVEKLCQKSSVDSSLAFSGKKRALSAEGDFANSAVGLAGGKAAAILGAQIGSVFGPVGTGLGAFIGFIVGNVAAQELADTARDAIVSDEEYEQLQGIPPGYFTKDHHLSQIVGKDVAQKLGKD